MDNYLKPGGRLGFVITQSIFKTKGAGDGFRQLRFGSIVRRTYIRPLKVHDLSAIQVFEDATNRTAVFICDKSEQAFSYPVPYVVWQGPSRIGQDFSRDEVIDMTERCALGAAPVNSQQISSQWLTAPTEIVTALRKVIGQSSYSAYAGCCTWLNGVFFLDVISKLPNGNLLVRNQGEAGKKKVKIIEAVIEHDLVYPLLRGRDIGQWQAEPSAYILLAQDPTTRAPIPIVEMKKRFPKTFDYLLQFDDELSKRSGYLKYYDNHDPFYAMYNVGTYTLSEWKVAWTRVSNDIDAAVIGMRDAIGNSKPVLPIETAVFIPTQSENEAHFCCAVLHSSAWRSVVYFSSVHGTGGFGSPGILEKAKLPKYEKDNVLHLELAILSKQCHLARTSQDTTQTPKFEAKIDQATQELWGLTNDELAAIQGALRRMKRSRKEIAADKAAVLEED